MDLAPFDFTLPEHLIALRPVEPRERARLLVVRGNGALEDHHIGDLPKILKAGDTMVFNDTRVIPAALKGIRQARDEYGRDIEVTINLSQPLADAGHWEALARPGKRLRVGDVIHIGDNFHAEIMRKHEDGRIALMFNCSGIGLDQALDKYGDMPLPPYIARRRPADARDKQDYQTSFAGEDAASVAAPTAGLHFTEALLANIDTAGIRRENVRLHVGMGTFAPLTQAHWQSGKLHKEWRELTARTAQTLNTHRRASGRIIPVGTTAMRTLESAVSLSGELSAVSGPTDIFIRPGDPVRATDGLLTNFHLPRSSLFMLVSALMGTDIMQAAYAHAIKAEYRFYSYGDACLLLP